MTISIFGINGQNREKEYEFTRRNTDFDKGKIELIKIGDASIGRIYLEPGWSWEKCVKPIAKTESCQTTHRQYVMSGRVRVKMNDGSEEEYGPGDVTYIPPFILTLTLPDMTYCQEE